MTNVRLSSTAIAMALLFGSTLSFASVAECDRLASHPEDPDRVMAGVGSRAVDLPRAITACEAAAATVSPGDPDFARTQYHLGRVYFYNNQTDKAVPALEASAAAGYRQTQFVLGYVIDAQLQGIKADPCRVEDLWVRSARAGRLAAEVAYPNNVIEGRFKGCTIQASAGEMRGFLDAAAKQAGSDYYQGLLVTVLKANLARFVAAQSAAPAPAQKPAL